MDCLSALACPGEDLVESILSACLVEMSDSPVEGTAGTEEDTGVLTVDPEVV